MRSVQPRRRAVGVAVVSLCLVQFVDVLGVTVVVTSLPAMPASLHAAQSYASLIATGYAMFFGGLLMLGARLGDRFGHRRTILVSLLVFAAGAVLGATASSALVLMAGRCLQGAAAAGSVPSALRLLTTMTPDGPIRQRAIALWSAAGAAAGASGFVVGGIVTDLTSWRVVFWAFLPLAATLTAAIMWSVPGDRDADPATSLNLAAAGAGIGLSSVAATGLGTDVEVAWRGSASGIINTTAQLGTAVGTAVLLLVASATTGLPAAGTPEPAIAWFVAAAVAAAGALYFVIAGRRPGADIRSMIVALIARSTTARTSARVRSARSFHWLSVRTRASRTSGDGTGGSAPDRGTPG